MNRRSDAMQVATEVSLFLVTVAAIIGMHRLFQDGSFRGPLIMQAAAAHLTMALLRRARVRLLPAALIALAVGAIVIVVAQYMDTAWGFLPSPDTITTIHHDMDTAWAVFREQKAPAPVEPGFVVATSMVVWVIAFVADWGAFRTGVSFEALLPPATLFLFASVLGAEGQRSVGAAVFIAAALLFLLLHRTWRQEDSASWAALHQQRGRAFLVVTGVALAGVAVVAAGVFGPKLPGAGAEAIIHWRNMNDKHEARVVLSPLVDIRSRLVEQSNIEVFTVQTSNGKGYYWRLTALDSFDGTVWRSTYDTAEATGELPEAIPQGTDTTNVTQRFDIRALGQIWLPAAYAPKAVDVDKNLTVKFDKASSTLIVPRDVQTSDTLTYGVQSAAPEYSLQELDAAPNTVPKDIAARYLDLPDGFSQRVRSLADRLTSGISSRWEKVRAIQDYLRTFEYRLDVPRGHGENALERFLFQEKKGYCEQFAAAGAAMARSIGIPARVAVGFTKGEEDPNKKGLFRVKGRNAHAWPEVWLQGLGWVQFEPTPGRGPDGGEGFLGVPEAQDTGTDPSTGPAPNTNDPQTPATTTQGGNQTPSGNRPGHNEGDVSVNESPTKHDSPVRFTVPPLADLAKPAAAGVTAYLVLVPLALIMQRSLRRARAKLPDQKVGLAWVMTNERAVASGIDLAPSLTVAERAARLRHALPAAAGAIDFVAGSVERVTYAEVSPTPEEADRVTAASGEIVAAADQRRTRWRRILDHLDIRRLFPQPQSRRTTHKP